MSNNSTIKSPKPRWFNGILHSNSSSPNPDYDSGKQNTPILHFSTIPSRLFTNNQQYNMSPFSEISTEEHKHDVQSIQFDDDIAYLQDVKLCDTSMFTPNIQYGKVIRVLSGSELLVAARMYNGYTKVISPKLYCFRIRLRYVSHFGIYEDMAKEELTKLILDKIVLLTNITMSNDGFIDVEMYLLHIHTLKNYLKSGCLRMSRDDGNFYVNDTINNYIKYRSK